MLRLHSSGYYKISAGELRRIQNDFSAYSCSEEETAASIRHCFEETGYLPDTHTAVALHAARQYREKENSEASLVVLSTASPFKFPAAVLAALGEKSEGDAFQQMEQLAHISGLSVPPALCGLREKPLIHRDVIDKADIADYVKQTLERL